MPTNIHPTAIVSPHAKIDDGVVIGPFAIIEDEVEIGANTIVGSHAVIHSFVRIGQDNEICGHAVLGGKPQYADFTDHESWVVIGDRNVIREGATIHRSIYEGSATRVGSGCFLMAYSHIGHDCVVEDEVVLTNNVLLGGHVQVGQRAVLGGATGAHQFVRIGPYCMVAGFIAVRKDALPYSMLGGSPVRHYRLNAVGLRRAGIRGDRYRALEQAFRVLRDGSKDLQELPDTEELRYLMDWLGAESKRGVYSFAGGP